MDAARWRVVRLEIRGRAIYSVHFGKVNRNEYVWRKNESQRRRHWIGAFPRRNEGHADAYHSVPAEKPAGRFDFAQRVLGGHIDFVPARYLVSFFVAWLVKVDPYRVSAL